MRIKDANCEACGPAPYIIDCFFDDEEEVIKVFCARCQEEIYYISWRYDG